MGVNRVFPRLAGLDLYGWVHSEEYLFDLRQDLESALDHCFIDPDTICRLVPSRLTRSWLGLCCMQWIVPRRLWCLLLVGLRGTMRGFLARLSMLLPRSSALSILTPPGCLAV